MHISIAERLKPFDHTLGTKTVLPGSTWSVEIFPTFISIDDLSFSPPKNIAKLSLTLEGPFTKFTVQLNLEKGNVLVFGESKNGYFRYRITSVLNGEGLFIDVEKSGEPLNFNLISGDFNFEVKDSNFFLFNEKTSKNYYVPQKLERLSLGSHKAQDWALVKKRGNLEEILPVWLRLGQSVLSAKNNEAFVLLDACREKIEAHDLNSISKAFTTLFNASFDGLMVPSLLDIKHQGLNLQKVNVDSSSLVLLKEGAKLIRSCFISFDSNTLNILPALPVEFHAGRFLHFQAENLGMIDLEWSKKIIRRMILFADTDRVIELKLQKEIKRFRLKEESEKTSHWIEKGAAITLEKGKTYFFDRFEK